MSQKISIQSNRIHFEIVFRSCATKLFFVCPFVIIISNTCYDWFKRSTAARQLVSFVFPLMMIEHWILFPFSSLSLFCPFISHDLSFCKLQCLCLVHGKHNLYPKSMAKPFFCCCCFEKIVFFFGSFLRSFHKPAFLWWNGMKWNKIRIKENQRFIFGWKPALSPKLRQNFLLYPKSVKYS